MLFRTGLLFERFAVMLLLVMSQRWLALADEYTCLRPKSDEITRRARGLGGGRVMLLDMYTLRRRSILDRGRMHCMTLLPVCQDERV